MDWKRFFDRLGLNGTWWQWRIYKLQERVGDWLQARKDDGRRVSYRHKFCLQCGGLVPGDEKACPRCGARALPWRLDVARRVFALAIPSWCPVTTLIIAANIVNLVVAMLLFGPRHLLLPQPEALYAMGSFNPVAFLHGEYWRIITYGYLHIGLLHIAFDLIALQQVGQHVEQEIGKARFFALYTLAMLGGGFADLLFGRYVAGASGALFGLTGFGISYWHFYGGGLGQAQRNFFVHWAIYGLVFGFMVRADNVCHVGGLITGAVLGFWFVQERRWAGAMDRFWTAVAVAGVGLTALAFAGLILSR